MTIKDISIKNFRGIELLERLPCGKINSYTGKNDSGKSSILKALDAFFNKKIVPLDIFQGKSDEDEVEIEIRFEVEDDINPLALDSDGLLSIKKTYSLNSRAKFVINEYYTCYDYEHETVRNCWALKESDLNDYLETLKVDFSKSGRGHTNLSKIEAICDELIGVAKSDSTYEVGELFKNISKYYSNFEIPEFNLFDAEVDLNEGTTDFQNQFKPVAIDSIEKNKALTDQLETAVKADLETEFAEITRLMQKNVPELEEIKTNVVCNWKSLAKFALSLKFTGDAFDIPLSHKGTGFKRLLMVAYFEYLAGKSDKKYQYFGIEEPETYLHPQLQSDLLSSIRALSETNQFFITTHSPVFAGATSLPNIVVVKKNNFRSEYIIPSSDNELLNEVILELGIRPNHNLLNENYRKAVFVEGSGDCEFWKKAFDKLDEGLPDDIVLVPCGGKQVEYYVNAELCRQINRNFIVIVDSDQGAIDYASKAQNNQDLKIKAESIGGSFDILERREIENYYHPAAINRILLANNKPGIELVIGEYDEFKTIYHEKIKPTGLAIKMKNNMDIFENMTKDEWLEMACNCPITGKTDLERIIDKIKE